MSLITEEIRNFSFKGWMGVLGTRNRSTAPDNATYYEEPTSNRISVHPNSLLLELEKIPPAADESEAETAASNNPTIIKSYKNNPIHLTPAPGNKAFFATETYGDLSTRLYNFIMPQYVALSNGLPSVGYTLRLYQGDPTAGGTEITTTIDQSGADVGWFPMYGAGAIIVASSFSGISDPTDLWITGYQYIGKTASDIEASSNTASYIMKFKDSDLSAGVLQVIHNMGFQDAISHCTIKDNNNKDIVPDEIINVNENRTDIDFSMVTPITGTWTLILTGISTQVQIEENIINNYINSNYINRKSIG